MLNVHPLADQDQSPRSGPFLQQYVDAAERPGKPFLVSNCSGALGRWAQNIVDKPSAVAAGHGVRATPRGLRTLADFSRRRAATSVLHGSVTPVSRPGGTIIATPEGAMLPFAAGMDLLRSHGVPVAPHHLVAGDAEVSAPEFAGPYVVKLADVGHRTEHGAVELGITAAELHAAVERTRGIARRDGLPELVAVQPMLKVRGEAFNGVLDTELSPMVVFGLGGVMVEVLNRVTDDEVAAVGALCLVQEPDPSAKPAPVLERTHA